MEVGNGEKNRKEIKETVRKSRRERRKVHSRKCEVNIFSIYLMEGIKFLQNSYEDKIASFLKSDKNKNSTPNLWTK